MKKFRIEMQLTSISNHSLSFTLGALLCLSLFCTELNASPIVVFPACNHRENDGADVGQASNLCDADVFGNSSLSEVLYKDLIFSRNESKNSYAEKEKHITQLFAFVKASATQFILKNEKNASKERIQRFADDILAIAYHESRFTHYAYGKDTRFKLMAADNRLVSRGLMQINQSFHASRSRDNSLDIFGNLTLGMEMIYSNEKYIDESIENGNMTCITKKEKQSIEYSDLRLRAAWAAYNSGSHFCRFRKNDQWSANDKMFLQDLVKGDWRKYITDENLQTKIDVTCLDNGDEFCHLPVPKDSRMTNYTEKVLIYSDGSSCVVDPQFSSQQRIICASSLRLSQCFGVKSSSVKINMNADLQNTFLEEGNAKNIKIFTDRDDLCSQRVPELIKVGEFLKLKKTVHVYDEIDGKVIASLKPTAQVYQVIDYTVRGQESFERYYKIAISRNQFGYINGGTLKEPKSVVEKVEAPSATTIMSIPIKGTKLVVTIQGGIKIYSDDSKKTIIGQLPQNAHIVADDVKIKSSDNQMVLQFTSNNITGFIYVGRTFPKNTLNQYVRIE